MIRLQSLWALVAACAVATPASAAVIVAYDFDDLDGVADSVHAGVTASEVTPATASNFDGTGGSGRAEPGEAMAESEGAYEFALSAALPMALDALTFTVQTERRASGRMHTWNLYLMDGQGGEAGLLFDFYAGDPLALKAEDVDSVVTGQGGYLQGEEDEGLVVADLSGLPARDTWRFKIAFARTASLGAFSSLDNIEVTGSAPAPEPATLALVALGGMALLARRRR